MGRPTGTPPFDNDDTVYKTYRPMFNDNPNSCRLRGFNCVEIYYTYRGKRLRPIYEVFLRGEFLGSGHDLRTALDNARSVIPRKPKAITVEIIAVRSWGLMGDILLPVTRSEDYETWSGPVASVPREHLDGSGGLYCVRPNTKEIRTLLSQYSYNTHAYGIVALSGRVIEYEHGYRAQRAAIRTLIVIPPVSDGLLKLLADRYQCDVRREKK